jgi:TolC family type I secretion outer membrane protein
MISRTGSFPLAVLVALLFGFAPPGAAEPPGDDELTLSRAIETALANNHQLAASAAGVRRAAAKVGAAKSARLPRVELREVVSRTTNPVMVFSNLLRQETFGPENFDPARLNEPDALTNFGSRLTVEQPIWTGGKIGGGVDAAERAADAASTGHERARQQVVHRVIEAYTAAVLADRHLEVAREALETARAHVELVGDLYEGGMVVESDLLQAQVRESEIEEMVARAESARATALAGLNMAMGVPMGQPVPLPETIDVDAQRADRPLSELVDEALERRPDLASSEDRVGAAQAMVRSARAGFRPEIGVQGAYEANADSFFGADGTNWSVMVAATMPLFDGFETRSRVRAARAQVDAAREQSAQLRQQIELEVRRAYHDLRAATKRLAQARRAVELAQSSLRIVEDRYKEGLTTLVELLDAETALTRARTRRVAARRDVLLSGATLDLAVGRL